MSFLATVCLQEINVCISNCVLYKYVSVSLFTFALIISGEGEGQDLIFEDFMYLTMNVYHKFSSV